MSKWDGGERWVPDGNKIHDISDMGQVPMYYVLYFNNSI